MKRSLTFLLPAVLLLASCGGLSEYASGQKYPDGIYFRPQPEVQPLSVEDFRNRASEQLAADSLRLRSKFRQQESQYDDYAYYSSPYYRYYGPYFLPYYATPYSYNPFWYGGRLGRYGWGLWDPYYDPLWDSYWYPFWHPYVGYSSFWAYDYYRPYPYYPGSVLPVHGNPGGHSSGNLSNVVSGGGNHRRAGSVSTSRSGGSSSMRRAGSASGSGSSGVRSSGGARRSGGYSVSSGSSYSAPSRSESYSSGRSGGYSGGGSYSGGGGYSGGGSSSHSGGSGGGGGGRR